jgi:hypothetical protein
MSTNFSLSMHYNSNTSDPHLNVQKAQGDENEQDTITSK